MSAAEWLAFAGIWTLAGLPLGPNAANCILVASQHGIMRAHWCVLGILIASFLFQMLVFIGVASLLAQFAGMFTIIKLLGAAYLLWIACRLWQTRAVLPDRGKERGHFDPSRAVWNAVLISLSNPKAILSYAAVFAQFIDPARPVFDQALVLTPTALAIIAAIYSGYCLSAAPLGLVLTSVRRVQLFNRTLAAFFASGAIGIVANEARR